MPLSLMLSLWVLSALPLFYCSLFRIVTVHDAFARDEIARVYHFV